MSSPSPGQTHEPPISYHHPSTPLEQKNAPMPPHHLRTTTRERLHQALDDVLSGTVYIGGASFVCFFLGLLTPDLQHSLTQTELGPDRSISSLTSFLLTLLNGYLWAGIPIGLRFVYLSVKQRIQDSRSRFQSLPRHLERNACP